MKRRRLFQREIRLRKANNLINSRSFTMVQNWITLGVGGQLRLESYRQRSSSQFGVFSTQTKFMYRIELRSQQ